MYDNATWLMGFGIWDMGFPYCKSNVISFLMGHCMEFTIFVPILMLPASPTLIGLFHSPPISLNVETLTEK
jgi:hypothetical protein